MLTPLDSSPLWYENINIIYIQNSVKISETKNRGIFFLTLIYSPHKAKLSMLNPGAP